MSEGLARSNDLISLVDASLPSPATVLSSHALEAGPAASDAAVGSGSGAGHDVVMDDQSFDSSKGGKMELDEAATSNAERIDEPSAADQIAYTLAVEARQSQYRPRSSPSAPKSYSIESIYTIPHSTSINALSLPPCSSHIYSGGSDGIIRRYNLHATLNGNGGSENPDLYNLTAKPGGASTDRAIPVLVGYWENEEEGEWCNALTTDVKWGRKNDMINKVSPVHSLAIQSQELWGLSGTAKGSINLFTVRHDQGQIRHVFRSSTIPSLGHRLKSAVSVLTLSGDESMMLSGGWDNLIIEWDLNTGVATRDYQAHPGQISSISFRPLESTFSPLLPSLPRADEDDDDVDDDMEESFHVSPPTAAAGSPPTSIVPSLDSSSLPLPLRLPSDSVSLASTSLLSAPTEHITSPIPSPSSSNGVAAALVSNAESSLKEVNSPESEDDPLFDDGKSSEADADGDFDEDVSTPGNGGVARNSSSAPSSVKLSAPAATSLSVLPLASPLPLSKPRPVVSVPVVGSDEAKGLPELSKDVFLSTSIDGRVMIWDRRVRSSEKGGVRRLGGVAASSQGGNACTSASWLPNHHQIVVGRRSSTIEIHDLRYSTPEDPFLQRLHLPIASGAVSSVVAFGQEGRFIVTGSDDNLRIWDLTFARELENCGRTIMRGRRAFKVIPGHHGGAISHLHVDPRHQFLISASGHRGWEGSSSENLIVHEIKAIY